MLNHQDTSLPYAVQFQIFLFIQTWSNFNVHRCLLHNFGGNLEMYGILDAISAGPVDARVSRNSTMVC